MNEDQYERQSGSNMLQRDDPKTTAEGVNGLFIMIFGPNFAKVSP